MERPWPPTAAPSPIAVTISNCWIASQCDRGRSLDQASAAINHFFPYPLPHGQVFPVVFLCSAVILRHAHAIGAHVPGGAAILLDIGDIKCEIGHTMVAAVADCVW